MRIVLIGKRGVGKSATGNTILGGKQFVSKLNRAAVTTHCKSKSNTAIQVVDTPGFFDTELSNEQISEEVVKCIAMSSPGAHAFIVVVNFARFIKEEADTIDLIKDTFGQEVMKYMIILFVGKDNLEAENKSLDEYLKESPVTLRNLITECDNRYIVFNNRAGKEEQEQQSRDLIAIIQKMLVRNGGKYYSDEMYEDIEKKLRAEEDKKLTEKKERQVKELEANKRAIITTNHGFELETLKIQMKRMKIRHGQDFNNTRKEIINEVESGKLVTDTEERE